MRGRLKRRGAEIAVPAANRFSAFSVSLRFKLPGGGNARSVAGSICIDHRIRGKLRPHHRRHRIPPFKTMEPRHALRRRRVFQNQSSSRTPGFSKRSGIEEIVLVLRAEPVTGPPTRIGAPVIEPSFDHDRLDVYRLSSQYVASSFAVAKDLNGCYHPDDEWEMIKNTGEH